MTKSEYPDQTRNLNPTPQARVAMIVYGNEYSRFRGGSMDFWDHLSIVRKRRCDMVVKEFSDAASTLPVVVEALRECEEYFDQRADAEYFTESPGPVGNEEMTMLGVVRNALEQRGIGPNREKIMRKAFYKILSMCEGPVLADGTQKLDPFELGPAVAKCAREALALCDANAGGK